jgi:hypothetical protein
MKTKHALGVAVALSLAVLVPLYGDPRRSPVTHTEWARMMMRSLGFEEMLDRVDNAEEIFTVLAWKNERTIPAPRYKRATGVVSMGDEVQTGTETGEVAYDLPIVRDGDYSVRLKVRGNPDQPFTVEIRKDGDLDSVQTSQLTGSGNELTTVDLGWIRLRPGAHTLSVALPPGTSLESIHVSPPCFTPIEPEGGWRAPALTTDQDLARTMLQALSLEHELPPADEPVLLRADAFEVLAPESAVSDGPSQREELAGGTDGLHAVVYADIDKPGLYAVSVWTVEGEGQTWLADSCHRADICPSGDPTPKWRTILTTDFNAGRHSFAVLLTNGATVGQLRLQRLKTTSIDYVATLKRLGFDVGPAGPINRAKANEAREWLETKWKEKLASTQQCVIQTSLGRVTASGRLAGGIVLAPVPLTPGPPTTPPGGGPPPLVPPIPPLIPPQPPATPVLPVR